MEESKKITVMNPMGYPPKIEQIGMAPRLDSLDGKTVYLVDCRFDDGDILFEQMHDWFRENMPQVNVVFVHKSGTHGQDDPRLYEDIKQNADAVVLGTGH